MDHTAKGFIYRVCLSNFEIQTMSLKPNGLTNLSKTFRSKSLIICRWREDVTRIILSSRIFWNIERVIYQVTSGIHWIQLKVWVSKVSNPTGSFYRFVLQIQLLWTNLLEAFWELWRLVRQLWNQTKSTIWRHIFYQLLLEIFLGDAFQLCVQFKSHNCKSHKILISRTLHNFMRCFRWLRDALVISDLN